MVDQPDRQFGRGQFGRPHRLAILAESHEMIVKRGQPAALVDGRAKTVPARRTIEIAVKIILPAEQQFHRHARHLPRDRGGLHHIIVHQPPPETAADPGEVDADLLRRQAHRLGHQPAPIFRVLGRRPDLDRAILEQGRAILRLQRGVGDEGIMIVRADHLARRRECRVHIAGPRNVAVRLALRPRRRLRRIAIGRKARHGAHIPLDLERFARLFRAPPAFRQDRHPVIARLRRAIALDRQHMRHPRQGADRIQIGRLERPAKGRACLQHRIHHAGQLEIYPEQRLARNDGGRVHAADRLADDAEIRRVFQCQRRHIGRNQLRRRPGQRRISHRPARFGIAYRAARRRQRLRPYAPLRRCRCDQHRPCRRARPPRRQPFARRRAAAACGLPAEYRGVGMGLLDGHLPPVDVQFLGDHHWQHRLCALAHFGIFRADDDAIVGQYADERGQYHRRPVRRLRHRHMQVEQQSAARHQRRGNEAPAG